MLKYFARTLAVFLLVPLNIQISVVSADTLHLVNDEYPPYNSSNLKNGGLGTEIVTTVLDHAGYKTTIEFVPWSRALKYSQSKRADGIVGAWFKEERLEKYAYSRPYVNNDLRFLKLSESNITIDNPDEISLYSIGIIRDYAYNLPIELETLDTSRVNDFYQGMEILRRKRVDLFPEDENVARYRLGQIYPQWDTIFKFVGPVLDRKALHMIISKNRPDAEEIIKAFNLSFETLLEDGTIQSIYEKHQLPFPKGSK